VLTGSRGNDTLTGGDGDDTLRGGADSDVLFGDAGDDLINGGTGIDTYSNQGNGASVTVNLTLGTATGDQIDADTLTGIENATGGEGNDSITGSAAANVLRGGSGSDLIAGGAGNDTLAGEFGADRLNGGNGDDVFLFEALFVSTPDAADTIEDFRPGRDVIDLSAIDPDPGVNNQFIFAGADFLPEGVASVRVFQDVPNNQTIVEARDTDGTAVDIRIILTGLLTLTAADFVL
jgi:Ca2+-binding RTX toxin-like protein